jgi:hypothetical protein
MLLWVAAGAWASLSMSVSFFAMCGTCHCCLCCYR